MLGEASCDSLCCQNRPGDQGLLNEVLAASPRSRVNSAVQAPGCGLGGWVCAPWPSLLWIFDIGERRVWFICAWSARCPDSVLDLLCDPGHLTQALRASVSPTVRQRLEWHPTIRLLWGSIYKAKFSVPGPLYLLFPLPRTFVPPPLAWLVPSHLSGLLV